MRLLSPPSGPFWAALLLLAVGPVLGPTGLAAQDPLVLEARADDGGVDARLGPVLESPGLRNSLERGLPVRILVVTELWRDRFIDAQEGRHEWRASVRLDPLERTYVVETAGGATLSATSLAEAAHILSDRLHIPLQPDRPGRYYYLARLEVETLSLSDLGELRRWMRGEMGPAMEGEEGGGVGSALGRGLQRLLVRVLGLPAERYQARSRSFDFPGE